MTRRIEVSQYVLNVAVNLAVPGIGLRALGRSLGTSRMMTLHIIHTLLTTDRIFQLHVGKKTVYHTVRSFVCRATRQSRPSALYSQMVAHMRKYAHRCWPIKELAQQLKAEIADIQTELDRGIGQEELIRKQVGALPLYGLA